MSVGWERARQRQRMLTDVDAWVAATGEPVVPAHLDVAGTFGDDDRFLLAAQHLVATVLFTHLDAVLEDPPDDVAAAVAAEWRATRDRFPGLRLLLDAHADRPALAAAVARQRAIVLGDFGVDLATVADRSTAGTRPPTRPSLRALARRLGGHASCPLRRMVAGPA